jgi:predicted DNA-binding transcriptional regulator YafY
MFVKLSSIAHFSPEELMILKTVVECLPESHVMKQSMIRKINQMYELKQAVDQVVREQNAGNVQHLLEAVDQKKQVILHDYASANSNGVRNRLVEPFEFMTNFIQIWCYEPESGQNKVFKTERMESVEVLAHDWSFEKEHCVGCPDIFGIYKPKRIRIRMKLNVRAASLLQEEYPQSRQVLKPVDENHWLLDTHVCSMEGVGRFVLGLMDDIEVISPVEFIAFLKDKLKMGKMKLKPKKQKRKK